MGDSIIFDTETTGLPLPSVIDASKQPSVIELGAIRCDEQGEVVSHFSQLVNPGFPISEEITNITGITNEDLADQPPMADVIGKFAEFAEGATDWIAHNADFDHSMILWELDRLRGTPGKHKVPDIFAEADIICTVGEYYHIYGRRLRLIELYQEMTGKEYPQTHRALDDCRALHEALIAAGWFA